MTNEEITKELDYLGEHQEAIHAVCFERLERAILTRLRAAEELAALVDHALTLEHLGEGSTKGWAEKALEKYRAAGGAK